MRRRGDYARRDRALRAAAAATCASAANRYEDLARFLANVRRKIPTIVRSFDESHFGLVRAPVVILESINSRELSKRANQMKQHLVGQIPFKMKKDFDASSTAYGSNRFGRFRESWGFALEAVRHRKTAITDRRAIFPKARSMAAATCLITCYKRCLYHR